MLWEQIVAVRSCVLYPTLSVCLLASCVQSNPDRWSDVDAGVRHDLSREPSGLGPGYDGPYDFAWQLSGDRASAPLQVFSTPAGVWLQFAHAKNIPAIFGRFDDGRQTLLTPRLSLPYVFVPGAWRGLVFRAGGRTAHAVKGPGQQPFAGQPNIDPSSGHSLAGYPPLADQPLARASMNAPAGSAAALISDEGYRASRAAPTVAQTTFQVSRADGNLRRALARWAGLAGWTFEPEHWALDADIPVSADADLGADFRSAVRALMASTEMGDLPAQPCFYANRVLRVVAYAQQCDPRGGVADRESATSGFGGQ